MIIKGADIFVGDAIDVPGHQLHDDLAGLMCVIEVQEITDRSRRTIGVVDKATKDRVWFKLDEELNIWRPEVSRG
jgi:hypothetical protein